MKFRTPFFVSLVIIVNLCVVFDSEAAIRRRFFSRPRQRFFVNNFTGNQVFRNTGFVAAGQANQINRFGNRNFNNFVDPRATTEIAGFSNLRQFGNNLAELDQFQQARRLFIDRNTGDLIGATESRTVQQLKEFYLLNRDKFQGGNRQLVDKFLARNGGLSNGKFVVDLEHFAMNKEIEEALLKKGGNIAQNRRELGLAALNYLLNTIQGRFKLKIPPQKIRADGSVELDLSPYLRGEALAILQAADPTSKCTGKLRINSLISFALDPANYYRLLNVPPKRKDVARAFGVEEDKTLTSGNKVIVGLNKDGGHDSGVASGSQRILEWQPSATIPGSSCYRSLDTIDINASGEQERSRDVYQTGIGFTHDAEEWLCLAGNGFMQGFLFNGAGDLLKRAPAEIASGGILGPSIGAVASCLDCHADGFIGGGKNPHHPTDYVDHFDELGQKLSKNLDGRTAFRDNFGRSLEHKDFFTRNSTYLQKARGTGGFGGDSAIFRRAREETGSEYLVPFTDPETGIVSNKPFTTLPSIMRSRIDTVTPKNAAIELGFGDSPGAEAQAKALIGNSNGRSEFDANFCNLKRGLNAPLNEAQEENALLRQQNNLGIGGSGINRNHRR